MSRRFAVISSTGASVIKTVYANTKRSEFDLDLIVVDRECGAVDFARDSNIELAVVGQGGDRLISDEILEILDKKNIDYVYVFYTRLLKGNLLDKYAGRIINFHPSLLPACPGLHGFEDTLRSGAMLAGSTAHYVDSGMDTGQIILQAFTPANTNELRHVIFSQQVATLYAIHRKLVNDVSLVGGNSVGFELAQGFLPNIDAESLSLYQAVLNKV